MNLKALALQVLEGKAEIKPTVKISEITPKLLTRKSLVKFTPVKLGNPHNKKQTIPPGNTWLKDHAEELKAAGFTQKDIYNRPWPVGESNLNLWNKEGLRVELRGGELCYTWVNETGRQITQRSSPERR
jgi:hypothetical protein